RGDGGDYDENFVMAEMHNSLTCKGKLQKLHATVAPGSDTAELRATLAVPRGATLDPRANGVGITLGTLQERVADFTVNGRTIALADTPGPVGALTFTRAGARGFRLALRLPADTLRQSGATFGLDSGEVCFQKPLRCKQKRGGVSCK